ncbi:uncharacterized protein LOC134278633 [Saccostrea cucullata]|uniref:uncharacterized protein LOC134263703 n=1 Tax=Saccostrea cuccullata TaxID=36930 RepID=UPI002ED24FFC
MLHLQEYMEILVWNNVNIVINVLKIFHAVFSLSRWKNKKFREKKSNLCECNVKQVGDIWIPPKVQISNAGTQTYDNEEDERIASMDMFGSDLDFWDFEISTIQAQWPKETIDDSGSQDEAVAVEEGMFSLYEMFGDFHTM